MHHAHHVPLIITFDCQLRRSRQLDVKAIHFNLGKLCQGGDNYEKKMTIIVSK